MLLSGRRLGGTGLGRLGRLGAVGLAAACLSWIVALRVQGGASAPMLAVPVKAARAALWIAALPVALGAAHQRGLSDRRDGFELSMLARGFSSQDLRIARLAAAFGRILRAALLPVVVAALASIACSPSLASIGDRLLVLVVVVLQSLLVGLVLAPLAVGCDVLAPSRGRTLCIGVLAASWALADVASDAVLSVTGALGVSLSALLSIVGLGRIG